MRPCSATVFRTAVLLATLASTAAPEAIAQTVSDYTEYTYAVPAGGIGSFANYTVTRTFASPIVSLHLYIVSGQADDIGYVGSKLVTNVPPMCSAVGAVSSTQEVSDQVTINGNTATFVLRAQENCCCVTGWGSATQGDRANARFLWVVELGGGNCNVPPVAEITDPLSQSFEAGNTVDTDDLTAAMQTALDCLEAAAVRAGGSITVKSAYRPVPYQQHLLEVWRDWDSLKNNRDPQCASRRADVEREWNKHGMVHRPAVHSAHSRGEAFDARWSLPAGVDIDTLADGCDLQRPVSTDVVHFTHK